MRFLTTAAMALALTGAAAVAHADQPQQQQGGEHHGDNGGGHHDHAAGQPHGQAQGQGGGGPHGQVQGGPHWAGPQGGGGPRNFQAAPQNVQRWQGQGAGQPAQGQNVQQWQGRQHHNFAGQQQWQGQGGQPAQGQNVQQWQGRQQWQGQGGQRNWAGAQQWQGQGGQRWQGQRGFGFENHALRGRDQGRGWYNAGAFAHQYHAERRFHFGGYGSYPRGWYARNWSYGEFLPFGWFQPEYYLDWADYGLPPPPVGCEWVAEGADAVLVDVWTGEILSVYRGVFYWNY